MSNGDKPVEICVYCRRPASHCVGGPFADLLTHKFTPADFACKQTPDSSENDCPACGGSGHKDDYKAPAPQAAVTEGPYVGGFDSITGPAFGMTSQSQKLAGYFEKPDHAAKVANHVHHYAFAQGASSKQAEVDKLKAENIGLARALEEMDARFENSLLDLTCQACMGLGAYQEHTSNCTDSRHGADCPRVEPCIECSGTGFCDHKQHLSLDDLKLLSAHRDGEGVRG